MENITQLFKKSFLIGLMLNVFLLAGCGPTTEDVCKVVGESNLACSNTDSGGSSSGGDGSNNGLSPE